MTEPSDAAKAKANELIGGWRDGPDLIARVATYIQQVNDAAKEVTENLSGRNDYASARLAPFILPEPVDPAEVGLHEAWKQALHVYHSTHIDKGTQDTACVKRLSETLAKHGLRIVKDET